LQQNLKKMGTKKVLLLYSGGLDSTLLLELAVQMDLQPYCLLINYGQRHVKELEVAEEWCIKKSVAYRIIDMKDMNIRSKLTTDEILYEGVSEWYVPSRNLMFISMAASIAECLKINLIWYGANYSDREDLFPDCYQEWIYSLNKVLSINGSFPIKVEAPLQGMRKETVQKLAKLFNISKKEVFSGYETKE